ncbi:hypothetical protein JCM6882_006941 [Rhodosporidiobolus microsporus]
MPSSLSTDTAYATAPTSPSGGKKGESLCFAGAQLANEGGLATGRAPHTTSPTTSEPLDPPSSSTEQDRSSSSSHTASPHTGRKRKQVFYGKKEEEGSSTSSEERSSGDESEGYSGDGESESDAEEDGDGGVEDRPPQARPSVSLLPPPTPLWPIEALQALERGLAIIPSLGKRRVRVGGERAGRNGLLGEYIRRQTGRVYTRIQVGQLLKTLKRRATGNSSRLSLVKGGAVPDYSVLVDRDWSAFLGSDRHAHTKLVAPAHAPLQKKRKRVKQEHNTSDVKPAFSALTAPDIPPYGYYASYSSPPYAPAFPPPYSHPYLPSFAPPPLLPPVLPPSHSASSLSITGPDIAALAPLSPHALSAFLTSLSPSLDLTPAALALQAAGLASLEDLVSLIYMEDRTLEASLLSALGGFSGEAVATRGALEMARRELSRSGAGFGG